MKTLNEIKTHVICRTPLVGCLLKASEYKNISKDWQPINQKQEDFKRHLKLEDQINLLSSDEFGSIASTKESDINEWLSEHGFSLRCPKLEKDDFATASFVKLFVEWLEEAEARKMTGQNEKQYDCVTFRETFGKNITLNDKKWDVSSFDTKDTRTKIFVATTDDYDFNNIEEEILLNLTQTLQGEYCKSSPYQYKIVTIPMLNLNLEISQDWICGIKSEEWFVAKCIQQFILKLNEKGATAKSAAVMSISRGMSMPTHPSLTFDKPFLLWFSRDGVTFPIFLSVCGYDCWEKPENLD